jgi:hypothetical protein
VTRTIALRAAGLVLLGVAAIVGLTLYFSSQKIPPCLRTGVPAWRPPTDASLHRFLLVVPDRALCLFDMDHDHELAGYIGLKGIGGVTAIAPRPDGRLALRYGDGRGALVDLRTGHVQTGVPPPPAPSDTVVVRDSRSGLAYVSRPRELGVVVRRTDTGRVVERVRFPGFTWNPRFGPDPPDHGLSLAPDRPELWVLDAPNNIVHVLDASGTRLDPLANVRLTQPLSGDENPCASDRCARIGSLLHSADGRFVYVGDAGDVIDAARREQITNLEALHQSRLMIEVDWFGGTPAFPATGAR